MKCPDCGEEIIKHECKKPDYVFTDINEFTKFRIVNRERNYRYYYMKDYTGDHIKVWLT
jgi:hypothetical protein